MKKDNEKLPLEYPIGKTLHIYATRILIFLGVVALNLLFLVIFLLTPKLPVLPIPTPIVYPATVALGAVICVVVFIVFTISRIAPKR